MTKQKTLPLLAAALLLGLLTLALTIRPGLAQSRSAAADQQANPDQLFNCTWSNATVYPQTILDEAVVSVGSFLYSFGGVSTSIIGNANKFDGTAWTPIAPLPQAVEYPAAVTDGTVIYILGGAEPTAGTPQTTLTKYDPVANTYTPLAPFTTGTWNHCAVYLNGKIYKFAGTGPGTSSTNVMEIYDVASNTWTAGAVYPLAESFVSGWTQGGFIYGAGGINSPASAATNKTFRYDPASNTWDDAAIADLPLTRWGAATAVYTDAVLAGGYVNGVATANISNTVISWDVPTNTWLSVPNMLGERARFSGAVLNNSFYVIGGRSIASPSFVGTNDNQKLLCLNTPTNILTSGGSAVGTAGPDNVLDPGEMVTVSFGVQNTGGPGQVCTTGALTGTLQATGGVLTPSAPQIYGALCSGNGAAFRNFTFTVDPALTCGSTVTASIVLTDGATNYGTITYSFQVGSTAIAFSQNFDSLVPPALPAGWTPTASGSGVPPTTSTTSPDTAPNDVFLSEQTTVGLSEVATADIAVPNNPAAKLSFRNLFNTESTFDGLVLEISIAGGAFQDILAAGGTFASGGYNSTLSTGFDNPLPGRQAWTGLSGGSAASPTYITTVVNFPAAALGQNVKLKWRQGSDSSVAPTNPGSRIDSIAISAPACNTTAPTVANAVSRKTHGAAGVFDINLPRVPITGAIGIEPRGGVAGQHQIVVTFANPVTVGSATVTGAGAATVSTAGTTVTVNLTNVTNAQRMAVTLSNVSDGTNLGNIVIPMGVLLGDVGGNGSVTGSDVSQTKAAAAAGTVDATSFRADININGTINATDVSIDKAASGTALP
jgi:hypothetical protein